MQRYLWLILMVAAFLVGVYWAFVESVDAPGGEGGVVRFLEGSESSVKGQVGICPMVQRKGGESAATLGGWGFGLSRDARDAKAAWTFAQFASGPETQRILPLRCGAVPTRHALVRAGNVRVGAQVRVGLPSRSIHRFDSEGVRIGDPTAQRVADCPPARSL